MQLYTGGSGGDRLDKYNKYNKYNLGIMISSSAGRYPSENFKNYPCALDNGAFSYHKSGYPFLEYVFLKTLTKCYQHKITLDFIVCPDIVEGGLKSLDFSISWTDRLMCNNLALVVQDGVLPKHLTDDIMVKFSHIFIGGSVYWKWDTAEMWVTFAKEKGKKIHIGQCGQLHHLRRARELNVDSVDSTSWAVNQSWYILEEYVKPVEQINMGW